MSDEINQPARFQSTDEQRRLQDAIRAINPNLVSRAYWEGNGLWSIDLSSRSIGDQELAVLSPLMAPPQTLVLQLQHSVVSDEGLQSLRSLTNLVQVDFGRKISDAGVVHLSELRALQRLTFFGAKLTDEALHHLSGLRGLTRLNLECKKVTDAGMIHIRGLTNLEFLNLRETKVSDIGLRELYGLNKLKELFIRGPRITEVGVDEIRRAIPGLEVSRWP